MNELQTRKYLNKNQITNKRINTIIHTQINKKIKTKNMISYDNVTALSYESLNLLCQKFSLRSIYFACIEMG